MLPLVLYNGNRPWRGPLDAAELIEALPGGLAGYRPSLRYLLLDESRYGEQDLPPSENLAAALFRLEKSQAPEELRRIVKTLAQWIYAPEQASLRRAFTVWLRRVLLPARPPGVALPETADLNEVHAMLAERVIEWTKQWKAESLEEGRKEGLRQGLEEGRVEGRQEGEMTLLVRLLEHKFGPLDATTKARLAAADAEQLLLWSERVLTADNLEALFEDNNHFPPEPPA